MKKLNQKLVLEAKITYVKDKQATDLIIIKAQS
jgi:hypothetical protein